MNGREKLWIMRALKVLLKAALSGRDPEKPLTKEILEVMGDSPPARITTKKLSIEL